MAKYSDVICAALKAQGYTHCFFVAGGNIMHLLESASRYFTCVAVVHEVAAGIAAEYFNESETGAKAFALVTAGPGLTNIVTAMAGAYLESRELLVIGGQVKTADLAHGKLRQRGIQEIDGVSIAAPVSKRAVRLDEPVAPAKLTALVNEGASPRKGPIFLELPLNVQGQLVDDGWLTSEAVQVKEPSPASAENIQRIEELVKGSERPVLLLGGGITRKAAAAFMKSAEKFGIPITTTWNGADRIAADHPLYFGRPNTWGQRYANLVLQQSDCIIALGTRLGMQQTGFNWQKFAPVGKVIQVDCDKAELEKGHPRVDLAICADANATLLALCERKLGDYSRWIQYCREIKEAVPLIEPINTTGEKYISPYRVCEALSGVAGAEDIIVPCSSGGAFTVMMQTFAQKQGQTMITDKGLASMGYGLSGAIGAAFANPDRRVLLVEGDGGFTQNLQELGTAQVNKLNLKIFIFNDNGYASIRMTQKNYFGGKYVGCDIRTGLGIPEWKHLFAAYGITYVPLVPGFEKNPEFLSAFNAQGPAAFIVPIDPEQTYLPKIASRVLPGGGMESNPLHRMSPPLPDDVLQRIGKYLPQEEQ
ncbi:MAG TPA: thiamine pyrophosphate-binding protein [Rickettsiales bacterium]|nr:thiamine pyrophosphate-binding protein [Rickettsiales bacterium]